LDLSNNQILGLKNQRYDGLKALGKAIGRSSGGVLEELRIASNNLHASAICWLGNALVSCTLRVFDGERAERGGVEEDEHTSNY